MYIMRSAPMQMNDRIRFEVRDKTKKVPHLIDDHEYIVSYVDGGEPIMDGISLMGIRRIK